MLTSDANVSSQIILCCRPCQWVDGKWECPFCEAVNESQKFRLGEESDVDIVVNCSNCNSLITILWTTKERHHQMLL